MKWLLLSIVVLILSFCFIYFTGNEASGELTIGDQATGNTVVPVMSQDIGSSQNITSTNQTVTLRNPTFQEVKDFILKDPTSRNTFVLNKYECRNFAADVDNNAKAAGLRCAFVLLCYQNGQHAVVAFSTSDRGMIYIEPQTDAAIEPRVGGTYQQQVIVEVLIIW